MSGTDQKVSTFSRIIFFHIPKTAGMSLRGILVKTYREGLHFNTSIERDISSANWNDCVARIKKMFPQELDQHQVFKGHMLFGIHEILPWPADYITFLRDPVQRVVSHYRHQCRLGIHPAGHQIDPSRPDWNLGSVAATLDNYQTRLLAGTNPDLPFQCCTKEHLEAAKANLDRHFKFVGLTEQFDLSLMLLRHVCGWPRRFYVSDNIAPADSIQFSPAVLEEIRRLNHLDQQLYDYARERFDRLVDQYGTKLQAELTLYRLGNRVHRNLHIMRHKIKQQLGIERRWPMADS
ncbi:MAG: sulfotransferase family protein [Methylacidiphilales bacterium]|nr:sulfotransferase family protein [Candidatus Methylacidiphilales bacterium]